MSDTLQNQIERYLLNEMTEAEAQEFSARIQNDPLLKQETELTAMIIGATQKIGEKNDLAEIEVLRQTSYADAERITHRKKNTSIQKIIYWAVSSAAVILLAVVLNHSYQQNRQANQLFTAYYQPFADELGVHRGSSDISEDDAGLLAKGLKLYDEKNYSEALGLFNQISENKQGLVIIYKAVCLLETNKASQAVELLNTAISENGEGWEYYQDAQWYLVLGYLKTKRLEDAQTILQQIVIGRRVYAEKASEILQSL